MAKGLRSSRNKSNKSKLRSNVFGPTEAARKERLSAKLLELVSQPKSKEKDEDEEEELEAQMDVEGKSGLRFRKGVVE